MVRVRSVGFLLSFSFSSDEMKELKVAFAEEFVFEEHVFLFLGDFVDLPEPVHVELPDEALDLLVPEVGGKNDILHFFVILDVHLTAIGSPADDVLELLFLENNVELEDEVGNFLVSELFKIDGSVHLIYKNVKERTLKLSFKFKILRYCGIVFVTHLVTLFCAIPLQLYTQID